MKQLALTDAGNIQATDLKGELRSRFLSYAISTIASRALPDARDGLKPVHRRILYAMYRMRLTPDGRYRKCAAIVGDVLGKYHPHGDQAAYDALVRLAQDFSMRYPLIDGQGNFGSLDGDSAAAMRYTEAKLSPMAMELLKEIEQDTVPYRPNYDSTTEEPVFLPSRIPNLLVNGSSGIAVGMATNIPPHNLVEVVDALIAMIDDPQINTASLQKYIKGPDFPTGASMLVSKKELRQIYEEGRGSVRVRGDYEIEELKRGKQQIIITSLPYTVNKSKLVEKIASLIIEKKLPALSDIRDESSEVIRVVLEPKTGSDIGKIMAFLYKYTDLEYNFAVNMTALDPKGAPRRMTLADLLRTFLDFRVETTEKRLQYDLRKIMERLHILRGYLKTLKDLDKAIAIIRKSKTRDEARKGLMAHFKLDEIQANAILDLRLAALVAMELHNIKLEAAELEASREMIEEILKSKAKIKGLVKKELGDVKKEFGDKRRTVISGAAEDEEVVTADSFVEHEKCYVILSRNGWVRRIKSEPNESQLRFKDGDSLLKIIPADTSEHVGFFTSAGKVYVVRAYDLTATTGFGDPVQSIFKFGDGERIISAWHFPHIKAGTEAEGEFLAVMEGGNGFRFSKSSVVETTKAGRKYASVREGDAVLDVITLDRKLVYVAHDGGKGILFKTADVPLLTGPGAGVRLIKLHEGERVFGVKNVDKGDTLTFVFSSGKDDTAKVSGMEIGERAGAGRSYGGPKKKLMGLARG
jgi:DNA gyrase subunit A